MRMIDQFDAEFSLTASPQFFGSANFSCKSERFSTCSHHSPTAAAYSRVIGIWLIVHVFQFFLTNRRA
jgi:hypothetical protein